MFPTNIYIYMWHICDIAACELLSWNTPWLAQDTHACTKKPPSRTAKWGQKNTKARLHLSLIRALERIWHPYIFLIWNDNHIWQSFTLNEKDGCGVIRCEAWPLWDVYRSNAAIQRRSSQGAGGSCLNENGSCCRCCCCMYPVLYVYYGYLYRHEHEYKNSILTILGKHYKETENRALIP